MRSLLQEDLFMKLSSFGEFTVEVVPTATDPEIMHVNIGAANRKDVVSMQTNKDETIDQFCTRIRSMLRGLANGEPRVLPEEVIPEKKAKLKTWDEQKAEMKNHG
jgi:hypothetical protein